MNTVTTHNALASYIVRHGDDNVVIGQRLAAYVSRAPELEEDLAVSNLALDHIGVADHLFTYAAKVEEGDRSGDDLVMFRSEREYTNLISSLSSKGTMPGVSISIMPFLPDISCLPRVNPDSELVLAFPPKDNLLIKVLFPVFG